MMNLGLRLFLFSRSCLFSRSSLLSVSSLLLRSSLFLRQCSETFPFLETVFIFKASLFLLSSLFLNSYIYLTFWLSKTSKSRLHFWGCVHFLVLNHNFMFKVGADSGRHSWYKWRNGPVPEGQRTTQAITLFDFLMLSVKSSIGTDDFLWKEPSPCSENVTRIRGIIYILVYYQPT